MKSSDLWEKSLSLLKRKKNSFLKKSHERMKSWNDLGKSAAPAKDMPMKPQVVTHTLNKLLRRCHCFVGLRRDRYLDSALCRDARNDAVLALRSAEDHGEWSPLFSGRCDRLPLKAGGLRVGDGGLMMLMCELATLVKYKLRVYVIVIKDDVLGRIRWEQMILEATRSLS